MHANYDLTKLHSISRCRGIVTFWPYWQGQT